MRVRLNAVVERLRASLFMVPMAAVIGAIALALGTVALDDRIDAEAGDLPLGVGSTVESARTLLSTVAGATITFAGIAFSISLLVIQLASSQYSPRVIHTLFRDPFNRRVMAVVVGTFTYCLMVLRAVRSSLDEGGDPVIPNVSVAIAVVLGIASVLAVVGLIDHNAHAMDVTRILRRVTSETRTQSRAHPLGLEGAVGSTAAAQHLRHDQAGEVVRAGGSGWVQQVDLQALSRCGPAGATIALATYPGRYLVEGAVLARVVADREPLVDAATIRDAVVLGESRTMQQDPSYGLRQIADVALRALSPGVNDPTTAQEAIFHGAAALAELLAQPEAPKVVEREAGGLLLLLAAPSPRDLIGLTFDEVRRSARTLPAVGVYLIEALGLVREAVAPAPADVDGALVEQAALVLSHAEGAGLEDDGLEAVRRAHRAWFGPGTGLTPAGGPAG